MPRKKDPVELAMDRVLRAVDSLPTHQQRLDVLHLARRVIERSAGGAPKERKKKEPLHLPPVDAPTPQESR